MGATTMAQVLRYFTREEAARLAGITPRRIRYWVQTGVFVPELFRPGTPGHAQVYTFRDVVALRTLALLRDRYGIPLDHLRRVARWLRQNGDQPFSALRFFVAGREVFFRDEKERVLRSGRLPHQTAVALDVEKIANDVRERLIGLSRRHPDQFGQITQQRLVTHHQPVIAGTRIPISLIVALLRSGYTSEDVRREYPSLTEEDIAAVAEHERLRGAA